MTAHKVRRAALAGALTVSTFAAIPTSTAQAHQIITETYKYCDGVWRYGTTNWGHVSGTLRDVIQSAISDGGVSVNAKITKHDSNGVMDQWLIYTANGNWSIDPGPVRLGGPYTPRFDYEFDKVGDGQTVWCRVATQWMPGGTP